MICRECGADVNNPEHASHIRSRKHQNALFENLTNSIQVEEKVNNDPGVLDILISHTERCGVSWFCRYLSLIYEQMFGGEIKKWNIRTSRLMAAHPDYQMQKGWNTVRYTPIKDIVKKPFDKIILLQRKLEALRESVFIYRFTDKDYETEKHKPEYEAWFNKLEKYYKQTYAAVDSPNVLRVYLEDLNNYTVSTFNEVLDFLNFPKKGRPLLIPVNPPERSWQSHSSVLVKGQRITNRLHKIFDKYNNYELEFIEQGNSSMVTGSDVVGHENGLLPIEKNIQNKWQISMNPNVSIPDALQLLTEGDPLSFQIDDIRTIKPIDVVIIGSIGTGLGCHFSENLFTEFKKMNINVQFLPIPDITKKLKMSLAPYHLRGDPKRYLPLSIILEAYRLSPDIVFIDGTRFLIQNDTEHFVFYNHRGWHLPFCVKDMDIAFLKNDSYREIRKGTEDHSKMRTLPPSVNLEVYFPEHKDILTPVGIGYRRTFKGWRGVVQYYEGYETIVNLIEAETLVFKKLGFKYFDTQIKDLQYREILKKIKILWFPIPYGQHITRRMLEAMACKVLCIFRLDGEEHEKYLQKLGFINKIHYIGLNSTEEIKDMEYIISKRNIDKIIENAYDVIVKRHTHKSRAKEIIDIYMNGSNEGLDVIVPMFDIQTDINKYIENWFKELPINRLILGFGKDKLNIPDKYHDKIITIDQRNNKTLGKCIAELMGKVRTKWFIFLHSDVKITDDVFDLMKKYMNEGIGGIEGSPIIAKKKGKGWKYEFHARKFTERAYSGFQIFRTECMIDLIDKIEDDYIYRNEDMILQNAVITSGFLYKKTWATYLHYNEGLYKKTAKDAEEIFLGLIKYCKPTELVKYLIKTTIKSCNKSFKVINPDKLNQFIKENNPAWLVFLEQFLEAYKK